MRSNSVWRNHNTWVCLNHLPCVRYPAGTQACWYYGCKSVRPAEKDRPVPETVEADQELNSLAVSARTAKGRPVARPRPARPRAARPEAPLEQESAAVDNAETTEVVIQKDPSMCAWKDCGKLARPNSKYCSRNCSNKNARWRHRQRTGDEDEDGMPDDEAEVAD